MNDRQQISERLDAIDVSEGMGDWTPALEQSRRLLRSELAELDRDERAVSRAMQGAKL